MIYIVSVSLFCSFLLGYFLHRVLSYAEKRRFYADMYVLHMCEEDNIPAPMKSIMFTCASSLKHGNYSLIWD